jgi:recombinational DNA repair ATPase RecF
VRADFARELERDLAQRTAELERMTGQRNAALDARDITQRTLDGIDGVLSQRTAEVAKAIAERDEARRSACTFKARYMDARIGFSSMTDDEANTEARKIAARMGWDCFDAKEAKR